MRRIAETIFKLLLSFAPLVMFWGVDWIWGTKVAIGATVVFIVVDCIWRVVTRRPIQGIYLLSGGLGVVFGCIDVYAQTPFMLSYEAVITSLVFGGFFLIGSFGKVPLIEKVARQQAAEEWPDTPELRLFFRGFTLVWAVYFLLKAALYLWFAMTMTIEHAMALRSVIGTSSILVMLGISSQGERIFHFIQKLGWLPAYPRPPLSGTPAAGVDQPVQEPQLPHIDDEIAAEGTSGGRAR